MVLYSLILLLLIAAAKLALAVQCPPAYVFDEVVPLHPSSCSAVTLCVTEDGASHFPAFDNIHLPCPSTLIALQCPEVLETAGSDGAVVACEYSVLQFDKNGLSRLACCDTFDLVFRATDVATQQRFLQAEVLGAKAEVYDIRDDVEKELDEENGEEEGDDEEVVEHVGDLKEGKDDDEEEEKQEL